MSTSPVPLSVAIVGCGVIGKTHADAVLGIPRLALTALVDADGDRAARLADEAEQRAGTRPSTYATVEDALAAGGIDLVVIGTPSGLHVQQAIAAIEAGAHVLIEKPVDVDVARASRLAAAAREAAGRGQVVSVISQHRFDPSSRVVREAIQAGSLGALTSATASVSWWRSQEYYDSGSWRGTWKFDGGGALMNQGVHTVDLLLWFLGRPVAVSAEVGLLAHEGVEVEDTAAAVVSFESGALAVLHATTAAYPGLTVRLQVMGSRGSATIDGDRLEYIHLSDGGEAASMGLQGQGNQADRYPEASRERDRVDATQFTAGHVRQYEDVLDAIAEGRSPLVTVDEALRALALVRAVYVSAATGQKVRIDDVLAGVYDEVAPVVPVRAPGQGA